LKCLVISPRKPEKHGKGDSHRTYQSIEILKKLGYDVKVIFLESSNSRAEANEIRLPPPTKWEIFLGVLGNLWKGLPLQCAFFVNNRIKNEVLDTIMKIKPDYLVLVSIRLLPLIVDIRRNFPQIKIIVDFIDSFFLNYSKTSNSTRNFFMKTLYKIEAERARKAEILMSENADACVFVNPRDASFLRKSVSNVFSVPLYVELPKEIQKTHSRNHEKIVVCFHGNLAYQPNKEAVMFILRELLPIINYPKNIEFRIIGRNPSRKMLASSKKDKRVVFTGEVKDIFSALSECDLSICPVKTGAGTQNKILEAVSLELPVIAHPLSASGTFFKNGTELLTATSKEEYAKLIEDFDRDKYYTIASMAKKKLVKVYSLSTSKRIWLNIIRVVDKRRIGG